MAGIKISALPAVPNAALTDFFPVVQAGVTSKETLTQVLAAFQGQITSLGAQTQALNMNTHQINNVVDPTLAQDAATKNYVDTVAQGLTIQGACRVATTGALTVTYNNVATPPSGVGATLTNAGAQAAIAIDGVTLSLNDRVLVKNQASALQNGIYTVTTLGSGATNWVMTRATDYDLPAQINAGDLVLINAGTANASSSWVQTATVTSVGVSSINFSQFTASLPITVANGGTGITSATAYGVIAAGTTSTGAFQPVTPGAAGTMFQSGGASALPTWSTTTYPATNAINTLLYASSANVMAALPTVTNGTLTTLAGVPTWLTLPAITKVNVQAITATGAFTYTKTAGTLYAIFELQGGGGGSGGAGGAGGQGSVGAGGNGGGYMKVLVAGSTNLAAVTGSVGVGGTAGTSGNHAGGNGGDTTLVVNSGSTWTAGGGPGGAGGAASASASTSGQQGGGTVTSGTNGTLLVGIPGGWNSIGQIGAAAAGPAIGSAGGASALGLPTTSILTAVAGNNYGAGAAGGANTSGSNIAGALGGQGIVIVTEFISI